MSGTLSGYASSLLGGVVIGLAGAMLLLFNGRIAGISGIVHGLVVPARGEIGWRAAFIGGLLGGAAAIAVFSPEAIGRPAHGIPVLAVAGLLVGFGTRMSGGCTSGHGVCGLGRLSKRSLVATLTFMFTGSLTAIAGARWLGGL